MSSSKIFAGSKLRRLRLRVGLSQAAFAQSIGVSASYLNLMERDQRPLTAQVVLKLSGQEGVDIAELATSAEAHALLQPLRQMLADPLLVGEVPPGNELSEVLQTAPNFAAAAHKLYGAYREALKRLSETAQRQAAPPTNNQSWLNSRTVEEIEGLGEEIWTELSPKDDVFAGIKSRLREMTGIDTRIMPAGVMGHDCSRYDRHSQRLLISEKLSHEARVFEAAHLLARLAGKELIASILANAPSATGPESMRAATAILRHNLALALLAPRAKFLVSVEDLRGAIADLSRRFTVAQGSVMYRMAQLLPDAGYMKVAKTGQVLAKSGKLPVFISDEGPICGQLPLFDERGELHAVTMQLENKMSITVLALREGKAAHALFVPPTVFAKTIYAAEPALRPVGSNCRLCNVQNCGRRTASPAGGSSGLNDYIRSITEYEPV